MRTDQMNEMYRLLGECSGDKDCGCGCGEAPPTKKKKVSSESLVSSSLPALEALADAMEGNEFSLIREAADALVLSLYEAGCPPMQHFNKNLGRCAKLSSDLHAAAQAVHAKSVKARKPDDHFQAHIAHQDFSKDLHTAGFHQLGDTHAARAKLHKISAAN